MPVRFGQFGTKHGHARGERRPDRSPAHALLVQETLLRATGRIPEATPTAG